MNTIDIATARGGVFSSLNNSVINNISFRNFINSLESNKLDDRSFVETILELDSSVLRTSSFNDALRELHAKDNDIITNGKFTDAIRVMSTDFLKSSEFGRFLDRLNPRLLESRGSSFSFSGQLRAEYIAVLAESFSLDTLRDNSLNSFVNRIDLGNFRDGSFVEFISTTEAFVLTDREFTDTLANRASAVLTNGKFTEDVQQLSAAIRTTTDFKRLVSSFDDTELARRGDRYSSMLNANLDLLKNNSNSTIIATSKGTRNEDYQHVMKDQNFAIRVYDSGDNDADKVKVFLNGGEAIAEVRLTPEGTIIPISIGPNGNRLTIVAVSAGLDGNETTVGVEFVNRDGSGSPVFIGDSVFGGELVPGQSLSRVIGLPKIVIDGTRSPYAAQHILDTEDSQVLTVKREGARQRRDANVEVYKAKNGLTPKNFDIDEVPLASTAEGSGGRASTRPIPLSDNRSAGSQFLQQIKEYGGKRVEDGQVFDLQPTAADYDDPNNIPTPDLPDFVPLYSPRGKDSNGNPIGDSPIGGIDEDNLIYGTEGRDIIRGAKNDEGNSIDYLLGDLGNDNIQGKSGNDWLLGQGGDDLLFGDAGDDLIYGGPGVDTLFGDSVDGRSVGSDIFVIRRNEGADLIADFQFRTDKIALVDGLKFEDIIVEPIRAGNILGYEDAFKAAQAGAMGAGETIDYPDFPGSITTINFGARISDKNSGEVLAFVNSPATGEAVALQENFIVQPGPAGKTSLSGIA